MLAVAVAVAVAFVGSGSRVYGYDAPAVTTANAHVIVDASAPSGASRAQLSGSPEGSASLSVEARGPSTNPSGSVVATNTVNLNTGNVSVYTSTNLAGDVDYVGITNNVARRGAEHLAEKGITINEIPGLTSLSRADARAVEQVLIESNGGPGGGQLLNKINSIAESNPAYGQSIQRGCQLLASVSYSVSSSVCP